MSTPAPPGMITNTLTGYWLAWVNRGQLLAILVPILVPIQVIAWLIDLVTVGARSPIINGAYAFAGDETGMSLIKLVLVAACWMWTVTSALLVIAGALGGAGVNASRALRAALRQLPYLFAGLLLACIVLGGVLFLGALIGGVFGLLGVPILIAALAIAAVLAARMLLGVATTMFGGSAWALSRGRLWATAGPLVLGGAIAPGAAYAAVGAAAAEWPAPFVWDFAAMLLLVGTVAAQAAILALVYLQPRREGDPGQVADLDAVDTRLQPLTGNLRRGRLAMVSLIIPALVAAALTDSNPMGSPRMQARSDGPYEVAAVAWPPRKHPIYMSWGSVYYCQDDLCSEQVMRSNVPWVMDGRGVVGIGADGTVVAAVVTGGEENGGPFIEYGVCTEATGCRQRAWIPVRASAEEPFSWPQLAVAPAPDGGVWFGMAKPPGYDQPDDNPDETVRFEFLYCPDYACAQPQRYPAGTTEGGLDGSFEQHSGGLTVDAGGRPTATFEFGHVLHTITCDPADCANPKLTKGGLPPHLGLSTDSFSRPFDGSFTSSFDGSYFGSEPPETTMTTPTGETYMVYATQFYPASISVTFGDPAQYWQYRLQYCRDSACTVSRDIPLDVVAGGPQLVSIAVATDGRIIVMRPDRTLLLPSLSDS